LEVLIVPSGKIDSTGPRPSSPNIRGPQRQVFVVGVETSGVPNDRSSSLGWKHPGSPTTGLRRWGGNIRGPQRQVFVAGVETPRVPGDRSSSLEWKLPGSPATGLRRWSGNSQGPRRQAVPPARHQRQWPILFLNSISQSIGATRTPCLSLFPHSAGCSLDAPLMRRTLSCESLVFNRRIFSRLRASYGCGFHPEPTVSHARFNRLGRSATISRFNETPCRSYTSLPSGPAHGNRRALRRSSKPAPICVFVCGSV